MARLVFSSKPKSSAVNTMVLSMTSHSQNPTILGCIKLVKKPPCKFLQIKALLNPVKPVRPGQMAGVFCASDEDTSGCLVNPGVRLVADRAGLDRSEERRVGKECRS